MTPLDAAAADLLGRIHALDPDTLSPFRRVLHRAVCGEANMVKHPRHLLQHVVNLGVLTSVEARELHEAWGL